MVSRMREETYVKALRQVPNSVISGAFALDQTYFQPGRDDRDVGEDERARIRSTDFGVATDAGIQGAPGR